MAIGASHTAEEALRLAPGGLCELVEGRVGDTLEAPALLRDFALSLRDLW